MCYIVYCQAVKWSIFFILFLLFLLFVAFNYFQSSFSWGVCPPTIAFRRLGWSGHNPSDPLTERVYFFGIGKPVKQDEPDVKNAGTVASH